MSAGAAAAPAPGKPPLDEVMLAMDVVDTLRHRSQLVERELSEDGRDAQLKERLRKIYSAQGIEVSDRVLEEGVAALKEDRFVYKPPAESFSVKLARLYVNRGVWGRWLLGGLLALVAAAIAFYLLVISPRQALPGDLEAMRGEVLQLAQAKGPKSTAVDLYASGQAALRDGDAGRARQSLEALTALRDRLEQTYTLTATGGTYRIPRGGTSSNYYVLVKAVDAAGKPVKVVVTSEEDGSSKAVSEWGVRVDERVYRQVERDKLDDGIIQNSRFGVKRQGYLDPEYAYPTAGGAIIKW